MKAISLIFCLGFLLMAPSAKAEVPYFETIEQLLEWTMDYPEEQSTVSGNKVTLRPVYVKGDFSSVMRPCGMQSERPLR